MYLPMSVRPSDSVAIDHQMDVALPPQSLAREIGIQLLPGNAALTDGFYYACLTVS